MAPTKSSVRINSTQRFIQLIILFAVIAISASCEKKEDETVSKDWVSILKLYQHIIKPTPDSNYYIEPAQNIKIKFKSELETAFPLYENGVKKDYKSIVKSCELVKKDDNKNLAVTYLLGETKDTLIIDPSNILNKQTSYKLKVTLGFEVFENDKYITLSSNNEPVEMVELLDVITSGFEGTVDCSFENLRIFNSFNIENNSINIRLDSAIGLNFNYSYATPKKVKRGDTAFWVKAFVVSPKLVKNPTSENISFKKDSSIVQKMLFRPTAYYELNTKYTFTAKIKYMHLQNNTWMQLYDESGNAYEENLSATYTTTSSLNLAEQVSYCYPMDRQLNFYKGEYDKGYLMFRSDIAPLITKYGLTALKAKFSLSPGYITSYTKDVRYDAADKTAWFDIPAELENNKIYKLEITNNSQIVYTSHFRCSYYNKIGEKFADTISSVSLFSAEPFYYYFQINLQKKGEKEYFDQYEISGYNSYNIIKFTADLDHTPAYTNTPMNELYLKYPVIYRDKLPIGIPPKNNLVYFYKDKPSMLSENDIADGVFSVEDQAVYLFYKLPYILTKDLWYMANRTWDDKSPAAVWAQANRFEDMVFIKKGNYPFYLEYVLPGKDIITSKTSVNMKR